MTDPAPRPANGNRELGEIARDVTWLREAVIEVKHTTSRIEDSLAEFKAASVSSCESYRGELYDRIKAAEDRRVSMALEQAALSTRIKTMFAGISLLGAAVVGILIRLVVGWIEKTP